MIRKRKLLVAGKLGMDEDARHALNRLEELSLGGRVGVVGRFMPDSGVSRLLEDMGVEEDVGEGDFHRFTRVVVPFCGVAGPLQKRWSKENVPLADLSSPQVRRAQVALGILRVEGAGLFVIGRHTDPETLALCGSQPGVRVIEDTTDIARLRFEPEIGAVCQTTLAPRRVSWLSEQLRHRWRDARATFLNTVSPSMSAREQALEKLLGQGHHVIIVGRRGESSSDALADSALRRGNPGTIVSGVEDLPDLSGCDGVILTAGAFALDETVRAVASAVSRG